MFRMQTVQTIPVLDIEDLNGTIYAIQICE
jgi:hypothetical protein